MTQQITVSKAKFNKAVSLGVAAALAAITSGQAAPTQAIQAQPIKRGPGRPRKNPAQSDNVVPISQAHNTVKSTTNTGEAKPRGRAPVCGPLMQDAMRAVYLRKGGVEVSFEEIRNEMAARAADKKNPAPSFSDATLRNYLTTLEGKLWDRVSAGKYVPKRAAA